MTEDNSALLELNRLWALLRMTFHVLPFKGRYFCSPVTLFGGIPAPASTSLYIRYGPSGSRNISARCLYAPDTTDPGLIQCSVTSFCCIIHSQTSSEWSTSSVISQLKRSWPDLCVRRPPFHRNLPAKEQFQCKWRRVCKLMTWWINTVVTTGRVSDREIILQSI